MCVLLLIAQDSRVKLTCSAILYHKLALKTTAMLRFYFGHFSYGAIINDLLH
ncbi:hypothetical protein K661_00159 [Piscirickettsia salmonis LF-89 = ATCC VR-1361]|nr:hypothetical protein K661_00159 [Piscirickettsia salmonis LF-89 = ATCC VR-1361]